MGNIWLVMLFVVAAYYGILMPYDLYRKWFWNKCVGLKELDHDALPENVAAHFESQRIKLAALGFVPATLLVWEYKADESFGFQQRYIHADQQTSVSVWAMQGKDRQKAPFCYLCISVAWESGHAMEVINTDYYTPWVTKPGNTSYVFNHEESVELLCKLHQFASLQHEIQFPEERCVLISWTLAERLEAARELFDLQVSAGIVRYDQATQTYRLTVLGALRMMLYTCEPFATIVTAEMHERAQTLKASYGKSKISQ